jgi:hypothetical protein
VTIGTGIGAAFLVDGEVQRAADGSHGEAGHQVIDPDGPACYCGARGCWEQLAAGPALPRLAADAGLEIADGSELTAAARAGDPRAVAAFARLGRWIGLGLVNITAIFCPDVVVIGGSVGAQHHLFGRQVAEVLAEHAAMIPTAGVRVCAAAYPDDAGLLGAAQAAMRAVEHDERGPHMSGLAQTAETDYAGLVKRLQLPPDFVPPAELAHEELVASALTRHDVSDDTAGINRSIELIQRTRGGPWPTGPVTDEYNFVDAVWHEQEFREGSSFTYVVREADGAYVGCAYLYPMGGRTKLTPALLHHDVDVSWWVTPEAYERGRYEMLHRALRSWVEERFPFRAPYFSNAVTP